MPLPPSIPDLETLDLFSSVIELGSVSRAAARHHMSQPSASSRIRTLESRLGLKLLERTSTGSRLTADGELVAAWADELLQSAAKLVAGVASIRAQQTGLLRLAASYTIAEYLLPTWLDRFLANRPGDSITLDVANSRTVANRLESGEIDLGFVESPTTSATFESSCVGHDDLVVVVAARHDWARTGEVDLETFCKTPLVMRENGSGTRDALLDHLAGTRFRAPKSALDLGSTAAVRGAVINGSSPCVISRLAVATDLADGILAEVAVPGLCIRREFRAVWRMKSPLPRLARDLLNSLQPVETASGRSRISWPTGLKSVSRGVVEMVHL
jgi:DNA-binding transcriptional LysR family regulator